MFAFLCRLLRSKTRVLERAMLVYEISFKLVSKERESKFNLSDVAALLVADRF